MTEQSTQGADPTAPQTGTDITSAPAAPDPRDAQIAELQAALAAAASSAPTQQARPPVTTVALSPAEPSESYKAKVGDVVDFQAIDPHTSEQLGGIALVVEVTDDYSIVAPLTALQLPVTTLHSRAGG